MAWCPHCNEDRPIQRQVIPQDTPCDYCGKKAPYAHQQNCRGPVPGALDVCSYCNTPLFAKAASKADFEVAFTSERAIQKSNDDCFVVTATMGGGNHPVVLHMRQFRDEVLRETTLGNRFIGWYYAHGPGMARFIANNTPRRVLSYTLIVFPMYVASRLWLELKHRLGR